QRGAAPVDRGLGRGARLGPFRSRGSREHGDGPAPRPARGAARGVRAARPGARPGARAEGPGGAARPPAAPRRRGRGPRAGGGGPVTAPGRTRRHVLVVDDSGPARLLIRQSLEGWARRTGQRVEVVEAENGFEALR